MRVQWNIYLLSQGTQLIDWTFWERTMDIILESRLALQYSYILLFFLEDNSQNEFFEHQIAELTKKLEELDIMCDLS